MMVSLWWVYSDLFYHVLSGRGIGLAKLSLLFFSNCPPVSQVEPVTPILRLSWEFTGSDPGTMWCTAMTGNMAWV